MALACGSEQNSVSFSSSSRILDEWDLIERRPPVGSASRLSSVFAQPIASLEPNALKR